MKTIYAGLPIYDSYDKIIYNRTAAPIPFHCTRTKLLPFQVNVENDDPGHMVSMELMKGEERENVVTGWTEPTAGGASALTTLVTDGANITSFIGQYANGTIKSNAIYGKPGQMFICVLNITMNTGGGTVDFKATGGITVFNTNSHPVTLGAGTYYLPARCVSESAGYIWMVDSIGVLDFSATVTMYPEVMDAYFGVPQTNINTYTNSAYDTFTAGYAGVLESVIKTTSGGVAYAEINGFTALNATEGDYFRIVCSLILNSGTAPKIVLVDSAGADASNVVTLKNGLNYVVVKSTVTDAACELRIRNGDGEVTDFRFIPARGIYKLSGQPVIYSGTGYNYFQYSANAIQYPLPIGNYFLRMGTANGHEYYSEKFRIDKLYDNLLTGWTNTGYETWTSAGSKVTSAINSTSIALSVSNIIPLKYGEKLKISLNLILNSGDAPMLYLTDSGWTKNDSQLLVDGLNEIELIASWVGDSYLRLYNTTNCNYSTGEIIVNREYSSSIVKLRFTNTDDLGNILYSVATSEAEKLYQEFYLDAVLNNPTHETILTGEEKDGIYIAEKVVTKYSHSIIAYINRAIYNCLVRLPQHDDIEITDEVGNTYQPEVGNVTIEPISWDYYDTGKLVIKFSDDGDDNFTWTH